MNQEIVTPTASADLTRRFTAMLPATRRGARRARRLTVLQLADWDRPYEAAEQIVAELAANAALHARRPGRSFRLSLSLTAGVPTMLRIAVCDPRPERLPAPHKRPGTSENAEAESGRGLLIVEALADRWGVDVTVPPLKTVWAELDLGKR